MTIETFLRLHLRVEGQEGDELKCFCPFHADASPSFSVNVVTGAWRCWSKCGGGKSPRSFARKLKIPLPELTAGVVEPVFVEPRYVPREFIEKCKYALRSDTGPGRYLESRGISEAAWKDLSLGYDESTNRITIPFFDAENRCVNAKLYDWTKLQKAKFIHYGTVKEGYGGNRFWPQGVVEKHSEVYLFAGEPDCLLAHSMGIDNAITTTGGEGSWDDSFTRALAGKKVHIIYDIDEAGIAGAQRVHRNLEVASEVSVCLLPITEPKNGDFTDYVRQVKPDYRAFMEWVARTGKAIIERVGLGVTTNAELYRSSVSIRAVVAGKDHTPYPVPQKCSITCTPNLENKACSFCPLRAFRGAATIVIEPGSAPMLGAIGSSQWMVDAEIRAYAGVPKRCPGHNLEITHRVPVWDVRLTNDLDSEEGREDGEFVARRAFSQAPLQANAPYDLTAIATSDPKTQKALLYVKSASSSQTGLDTFTIEGKEALLKIWEVAADG